jgi:hypothetical protein
VADSRKPKAKRTLENVLTVVWITVMLCGLSWGGGRYYFSKQADRSRTQSYAALAKWRLASIERFATQHNAIVDWKQNRFEPYHSWRRPGLYSAEVQRSLIETGKILVQGDVEDLADNDSTAEIIVAVSDYSSLRFRLTCPREIAETILEQHRKQDFGENPFAFVVTATSAKRVTASKDDSDDYFEIAGLCSGVMFLGEKK